MIPCQWCGGEHRRKSREQRECRDLHRNGIEPKPKAAPKAAGPRREGNEATRYANDPLRGDARAHSAAKQLRAGTPARLVAKRLGLNLSFVRDVERRMGG